MTLECWQEVINDYEKLLEIDEGYDVIIYAGEEKNIKELHAHSNILRIRSRYFRNELTKENVEKREGRFLIKVPNISPQIFKMILRFIYCGKIDFTKLEGPELLKLSIAADALNIQSLIPRIEEYLIKNQREFLQKNPIDTLEIIYQHETFTKLWNFYLEKICEEPEELFNSDKFINIKSSLLELLLKRDDLCLEEIDIWNSLIKWSFAQNPSVPRDANKWSKEETTIMERTFHRYIPLVRFYCMSSEEFLDKVCPFRDLLPRDLFNNLLAFHLAPNRKLDINIPPPRLSKFVYDSLLVKHKHFAAFSSWIDKKNNLHYNVKNMPYKFDLLYRASKDGNTPAMFHQKCNNKGATIVIVKISGSGQIVGGYNSLLWDSSPGKWLSTLDSFVFSFNNKTDLQTAKVGYSKGDRYSIGCFTDHGPIFGSGSGNDLIFHCNNGWSSKSCSYSPIDIPATFKVDDYEVFQVTKK